MVDEIWKPIPDFKGSYEASSGGLVRSVDRIAWGPKVKKRLKGQLLKPKWSTSGFCVYTFSFGGQYFYKTRGKIMEEVFGRSEIKFPDLSVADLAYAAGIIDGEGSIHVKMDTKFQKIGVQVGMVEPEVVDFMAAKFGGRVILKHRKFRKEYPNEKPTYCWALWCRRAAAFLQLVEPYLKIKGSRARDAILLANMAQRQGGKRIPVSEEELEIRKQIATRIKRANFHSNGSLARHAEAFEARQ